MTKVLVSSGSLEAIADAIRTKNGSGSTYKPGQMAAAIAALPTTLVSKTITSNGSYNPASDSADGYSAVTVNVPNSYAAADEGKVVSSGALVAQTARASEITANGTYDTTLNDAVTVNVSGGSGSYPAKLKASSLMRVNVLDNILAVNGTVGTPVLNARAYGGNCTYDLQSLFALNESGYSMVFPLISSQKSWGLTQTSQDGKVYQAWERWYASDTEYEHLCTPNDNAPHTVSLHFSGVNYTASSQMHTLQFDLDGEGYVTLAQMIEAGAIVNDVVVFYSQRYDASYATYIPSFTNLLYSESTGNGAYGGGIILFAVAAGHYIAKTKVRGNSASNTSYPDGMSWAVYPYDMCTLELSTN